MAVYLPWLCVERVEGVERVCIPFLLCVFLNEKTRLLKHFQRDFSKLGYNSLLALLSPPMRALSHRLEFQCPNSMSLLFH